MSKMSKEEISFIKWDDETVKKLLPDIQVLLDSGEIVTCQIGGRLLPFAGAWGRGITGIEISWGTIAHCLNNDKPVRI